MTNYYSKLLFSSKIHFLLLRPDVLQQRNRLLGTAAAREIPINGSNNKKSISRLERKAMARDCINKYRVINAGKFPTVSYVMRQVGGKFYTIRAILQEMQHNLKVSATSKDEDNLTIGKKVQVKGISDVGVTSQCHVSDDAIAVVDKIAIPTECNISRDDVMDKKNQKMVYMSNINKNHENPTENVPKDADNFAIGEKAQVRGISDAGVTSRCHVSEDVTAVVDKVVISTECNISCDDVIDKKSQKMVDMSYVNNNQSENVPKNADNLTIGKKAPAKEISDVGVTYQYHLSDDVTAVADKIAVSTEYDISHDDVMDEKSQKMVNVSYININHENTTENVSRGERKAGLELGGESNMVSANKVTSDNNRVPESKEVLVLASTVENASSNEIVTMDGSKSPVIPGHPSEVSSTSKNLEPKEVDEVSAQAFNAAEVTRVTTTQRTKDKELQESSLWDNLKGLASSIISFWRKT